MINLSTVSAIPFVFLRFDHFPRSHTGKTSFRCSKTQDAGHGGHGDKKDLDSCHFPSRPGGLPLYARVRRMVLGHVPKRCAWQYISGEDSTGMIARFFLTWMMGNVYVYPPCPCLSDRVINLRYRGIQSSHWWLRWGVQSMTRRTKCHCVRLHQTSSRTDLSFVVHFTRNLGKDIF